MAAQRRGEIEVTMFRKLLCTAVLSTIAATAQAQMPGYGGGDVSGAVIGTWAGVMNGSAGPAQVFEQLSPNGRYGQMTVMSNGNALQTFGRYMVEQVGPAVVRVTFSPDNYLPKQLCMAGGACTATQPPSPGVEMLQIVGPGVLQTAEGITLQRTPLPPIAQQPLPVTLMIAGPQYAPGLAPMPALHPYVTPNGARYDSRPAQDFIHQRLRGCSPDPGTLHSYTICDSAH